MARNLGLVVNAILAVLATSTVICLHITAGVSIDRPMLRGASGLSAFFEAILLFILSWVALARMPQRTAACALPRSRLAICLALEMLLCTLATAASAVALICLAQPSDESDGTRGGLLAASSVAVALAAVLQATFFITHFLAVRHAAPCSASCDVDSEAAANTKPSRDSGQLNQSSSESREMASLARKDSTPSTTGTMNSLTAPPSQPILPGSSRSRLLPTKKEQRRPESVDSLPERSSAEDSFDSWDTSSVDTHNRQVVVDSLSPPLKSRLLETIPASPTTSRSPSPGTPTDLEPPPWAASATSPSGSSTSLRQRDEVLLSPPGSANESHIHPLFRSDSPTPPPVALPGTSVVASPNAGQVISRRESMQSLKSRKHSGSVACSKRSLGRQTSIEGSLLRQQSRHEQTAVLTEELLESPLQPPAPRFSILKD
ncbi:hypothetical protein CDD82_1312 [Ophiocordyceps australis]|uniref:Uncharacterized protein n=1 Tax=Ophiocordyceps australis TaxID=1399860 RepID=A0A2C5ZM56_9HYPO|nr:hypothetical protein CDD82_1312 [Ophiocordyceps australis]